MSDRKRCCCNCRHDIRTKDDSGYEAAKAIEDTKVAVFLGNNVDRIKAIEDAMNRAIAERGE